jgi:hypothetical protein
MIRSALILLAAVAVLTAGAGCSPAPESTPVNTPSAGTEGAPQVGGRAGKMPRPGPGSNTRPIISH